MQVYMLFLKSDKIKENDFFVSKFNLVIIGFCLVRKWTFLSGSERKENTEEMVQYKTQKPFPFVEELK